jgi:hypothetical protein
MDINNHLASPFLVEKTGGWGRLVGRGYRRLVSASYMQLILIDNKDEMITLFLKLAVHA